MIFAVLAVGKHLFSSKTLGRHHWRTLNAIAHQASLLLYFSEKSYISTTPSTLETGFQAIFLEGYSNPHQLFFLLQENLYTNINIYTYTYFPFL